VFRQLLCFAIKSFTASPRWGFLSVFVAFHPGAAAAPGSTQSPLCGLGLPECERIDYAMSHSQSRLISRFGDHQPKAYL
jgi:hypothetical protein